jgi:hypothetical protein
MKKEGETGENREKIYIGRTGEIHKSHREKRIKPKVNKGTKTKRKSKKEK